MTTEERAILEQFADNLEGNARILKRNFTGPQTEIASIINHVFSLAWEIKQVARKGTSSEGV